MGRRGVRAGVGVMTEKQCRRNSERGPKVEVASQGGPVFSLYLGRSLWTELFVEVLLRPERFLVIYGTVCMTILYSVPCSILSLLKTHSENLRKLNAFTCVRSETCGQKKRGIVNVCSENWQNSSSVSQMKQVHILKIKWLHYSSLKNSILIKNNTTFMYSFKVKPSSCTHLK